MTLQLLEFFSPLFVFSHLWCSKTILSKQRTVQGHAAVGREDKDVEGILVVNNLEFVLPGFTLGFSLSSYSMRFSPALEPQVAEGKEVQQGLNPTFIRERARSVPMYSGLFSLCPFPTLKVSAVVTIRLGGIYVLW